MYTILGCKKLRVLFKLFLRTRLNKLNFWLCLPIFDVYSCFPLLVHNTDQSKDLVGNYIIFLGELSFFSSQGGGGGGLVETGGSSKIID